MRWSRIAATGKAFHTRKRLRACSAAVEPSLTPPSFKHSFPSPSRKPPTSSPPPERVCRQRCRQWFIFHSGFQHNNRASPMCGEVFILLLAGLHFWGVYYECINMFVFAPIFVKFFNVSCFI